MPSPNFSELARLSNAAQRGTAKARRRARIAALTRWRKQTLGKTDEALAIAIMDLPTQGNHETITTDNREESAGEPAHEKDSQLLPGDEEQANIHLISESILSPMTTPEETVTEVWLQ